MPRRKRTPSKVIELTVEVYAALCSSSRPSPFTKRSVAVARPTPNVFVAALGRTISDPPLTVRFGLSHLAPRSKAIAPELIVSDPAVVEVAKPIV